MQECVTYLRIISDKHDKITGVTLAPRDARRNDSGTDQEAA